MSRFSECLIHILANEGGFSDDPVDHGGRTNHGITQAEYNIWREEHNFPDADVKLIPSNEVQAFYQEKFWIPSNAGHCPAPLDLLLFDCSVNSGIGVGVRTLQRAVGADPDGVFGQRTLSLVNSVDLDVACKNFLDQRCDFYNAIVARHPDQSRFIKGWLNRVAKLQKICQETKD